MPQHLRPLASPADNPPDTTRRNAVSARHRFAVWQKLMLVALGVVLIGGVVASPAAWRLPVMVLTLLPFMALAMLRVVALATPRLDDPPPLPDHALPAYTVLVPLYREVAVLPALLAALNRLDYPRDRLEVVLLLEADDLPMRAAVAATQLVPNVRAMVVPPPEGEPRTKPRALNAALGATTGELVTVFDAEDEPEPDQLRRAAALIRAGGGRTGCVQAGLAVYNRDAGFLTRQFTIEYAAQFERLLPAIDRIGLPIPLGGTSNHMPRAVLEELGGWDAFNVTEDADLGVRLARAGYRTAVLASSTWEEAPSGWHGWLPQRTRWLKGWMQTWAAHMRAPAALWRDLGAWRFLGFQLLIGGQVLSALVHPWFYVLLGLSIGQGTLSILGEQPMLVEAAAGTVAFGYLAPMALGAAAVRARGWRHLVPWVVAMPLYWLLISLAAYRALWQLVRDPFVWEKTDHSARPLAPHQRLNSSAR